MSWDLLAFRAPREFKSPRTEDLPEGWQPGPFAQRSEVQEKLACLLPGVTFQRVKETLWGFWTGPGFSLEINLGKTETMTYLWVAVRGDPGQAALTLAQILELLDLRGVDLQSGEFFDIEGSRPSFEKWRNAVERFREGLPKS